MKRILTVIFALLLSLQLSAQIEFSTAGFLTLPGTGRTVENMNPAWLFHKGAATDAQTIDFDDSKWEGVSLPNGMEYLPVDASGGINYRGEAWYRKHFELSADKYTGKRLVLHFEAIMGKSKIWVNGELVSEHFGGFLPIGIDITDKVKLGGKNIIAVWADNSDDPMYPPGKPQATLDFCYFGGIYRDCWLISTNKTYITDANMVNKVADGGLMVHYTNVSEKSATVNVKVNLQNEQAKSQNGTVEFVLADGLSRAVKYSLGKGENKSFSTSITVQNPKLWSPECPNLYDMKIIVRDSKGEVVDGYRRKIGVRSIEFTYDKGFILNGKEYPRKLIGANRHQDFAVVGNALSNNLHWRDAAKLKEAGMEIIRNAHYPQDPAFMDACEELGLFVIVNTPGWQFWNKESIFEQRVYDDIRQMVRRDRNSPTVIMWEPILNETWYPEDFAKNVHNIVKEEFPYSPNYTACDMEARGNEPFDIIFTHPITGTDASGTDVHIKKDKVYFTREFGDNVDDWNSHNSPSRVARQWGEVPMLIQAKGYGKPDYRYTCIDALYRTDKYHFGGTLWHSFDHQRGYHPDPFYGGVMSSFRRPKYSYYMFQSQALWQKPMVYIANEMTPFSPQDVTVYSNCDEVRLYTRVGDSVRIYKRPKIAPMGEGMPSPIITFEKAFNVMRDKEISRSKKQPESFLLAEGYNDGKLVATHKVMPARRPSKIEIVIDTMAAPAVADGGDLVVVVAQVTDATGNVKRLNNEWVKFEVVGEARIVGDEVNHCNPTPVLWGEAPVLLQTTTNPGKVKIKASVQFAGDHTPVSGYAEFETVKPQHSLIYDGKLAQKINSLKLKSRANSSTSTADRDQLEEQLREVERQQEEFGEKEKK